MPEWASAYFKWWGVYTQGDGVGATGGKGGEGLATDWFMMRIGIPNGILTAKQLRTIAKLTRNHARNLADITVRQNIQLHWLTIESLPEVVDALDAIGLSPKGACGDVVRNVTGCPLAGVAADELIDASPIALGIARDLEGECGVLQSAAQVQDFRHGCQVVVHLSRDQRHCAYALCSAAMRLGYSLRVGGGLSNEPHLAVRLDAFVRPDQAVDVARGVTEIFRDQQGLRESRERARLKYLFMREGWTAERFLDELHTKLGFMLDPAVPEEVPSEILRDHRGHPSTAAAGTGIRGRISIARAHDR